MQAKVNCHLYLVWGLLVEVKNDLQLVSTYTELGDSVNRSAATSSRLGTLLWAP